MDDPEKLEQAQAIASLLLTVVRHIFSLEDDLVADLPLAQLRVCAILYEKSCSMSELSRELGVSLSAMTQIANRLERAKLVNRVSEGTDRRVRCLELTQRAVKMMNKRENSRIRCVLAVLNNLSAKDCKEMTAALELLSTTCMAIKTQQTSNDKGDGSRRRHQELLMTKAIP
jgi:DNA-binding MarR family transcriptional regulator